MTRNLDDLIDAVAREMTEGASPVDLRARVMQEIDRGAEAKGSFQKWGWLAAAAGILLISYLAWPERQPAPPASEHAPVTASVPAEQPPPRVPSAVASEPGRPPRAVRPRATSTAAGDTVALIPALAE